MKVFLDTNVWIASFLTAGLCQDLVRYCADYCEILISTFVLSEFQEKMRDKFKFTDTQIASFLSFIHKNTQIVHSNESQEKVSRLRTCRDSDDDRVLDDCLKSKADYLITGDQDLLVLQSYEQIPIVHPRQFWEKIRTPSPSPTT